MAKRKREVQDDDPSQGQGGRAKKIKGQDSAAVKNTITAPEPKAEKPTNEFPDSPQQRGTILSGLDVTEQRDEEDEAAYARKLAKRERRKLERGQKVSSPSHTESKVKDSESKKRTKQNLKKESSIDGGEDVLVNDGLAVAQLKSKKQRRKEAVSAEDKDQPVSNSGTVAVSHLQKQSSKHNSKGRKSHGGTAMWKMSDPVGGHMLDTDPIFSRDEEYLLIAYKSAITVYSTSTSLPVRCLRNSRTSQIYAFALSSPGENHVYNSTASQEIEKWDWVEGVRLGCWKLSSAVYSLATSTQSVEDHSYEIIYTVEKKDTDQWLISAHRLESGENAAMTGARTLFRHKSPVSSVQVLDDGRFIVATSGSQLMIGNTKDPGPNTLQDLSYTWRVIDCPEWITSIDARVSHHETAKKQSKGGVIRPDVLDIAVGGLKGSIHLYNNLLANLIRLEQPRSKTIPEDVLSRRLHWHRNSVLSLKWSLDGNYLISGGQETVLVLWQLETGRKQDIPHLGAPIESVVVSPFGASYGIRLADNSAMVLSTSELTPTFSVAGIQTLSIGDDSPPELPFVPTVDIPWQRLKSTQKSYTPACISPSRPSCLLLAVPASTFSRRTSTATQNAAYLQSFDVAAAQQISRQALTRTKITDRNMGPESNTIEEPNVIHIQTSTDGQWLATVDVWTPPIRDLEPLAFNKDRLAEEQTFREEVHLKFWSWHDDTKVWELVSRIDNPHASQYGNPYEHGNVLQLCSDPSSVGFATIGMDGIVKTWKPAIRRRHGLDVRDKAGKSLTSWHCKHVIPLESIQISERKDQPGARLAYSQDGSILVAGLQTEVPSPLFIVDTYTGEIRSIQNGLINGPLYGLGIINKYLITLSNELCIWNLVDDQLHFGIELQQVHHLSMEKRIASSHLAVNLQHGIFAIALPERKHHDQKSSPLKSRIAIFDPTNATPLYQTSTSNTTTILLPAVAKRGFYAIDSAAEVRTLVPSQSVPKLSPAPWKELQAPSQGLRNIFGKGQSEESVIDQGLGLLESKFDNVSLTAPIRNDDAVVISHERLAEIFDAGPAYRPVTEMFEQVASLCSGRMVS